MARTKGISIPPALTRASGMIAAKAADLRAEGNPDLAEGLELAHGLIFRAVIEEDAARAAGTSPDAADDPDADE